jgi:lipoprotein-anchoring transpeptidase ErfK/SrfK
MRRLILAILAALLFMGEAEAGAPPGSEAAATLRKVQESSAARIYPEEFANMVQTFANGEKLLQQGDGARAAQLFSLTILKGHILLDPARVPPPQAAPAGIIHQQSSAGETVLPEDLPQARKTESEPAEEPGGAESGDFGRLSARIIGGEGIYVVKKKERLKLVASRLGVRLRDLARRNRLTTDATVPAGQRLRYNNRRIAPESIRNGIVVNIPDRNLYVFRNGRVAAHYPVALGKAKKGNSTIWRTPTGRFRIVDKQKNPSWRIPPSIRKEMEENGEEIIDVVPPGPKNPLGRYAMRTSLSGILIHSTTRPLSINSYSSHGCIRVLPEHMEQLFPMVKVPTDGEIIYQPVKVEVTDSGQVFLEVNRDSYEKVEDLSTEVTDILNRYHAANMVSWQKVNQVIHEKSGIAEEVTLQTMPD